MPGGYGFFSGFLEDFRSTEGLVQSLTELDSHETPAGNTETELLELLFSWFCITQFIARLVPGFSNLLMLVRSVLFMM